MALYPTPENFRAEMQRHRLRRKDLTEHSGMSTSQITNYVNGNFPLTDWAAHNIGYAINKATNLRIFEVNEDLGVIKPKRGRPAGMGFADASLDPYIPRKRNRRRSRAG